MRKRDYFLLFIVITFFVSLCLCPGGAWTAQSQKESKIQIKPNDAFDADRMGDMSDFDPAQPVIPSGDTIKIAIIASFSGPGTLIGQVYFAAVQWVAHDINKRGGLFVDGKRKLVQVLKGDHMSKLDQCRKVTERMILQEKVNFLWGTNGGNMMKVINDVATKHKVIVLNAGAGADSLMDAVNFTRYSFMTMPSTEQSGRAWAYFFGQMRKKERSFYLLNPDYVSGHEISESFKEGLKKYFPEARIVGEDFYRVYTADFVPYLEKVKASGADILFTIAFPPDADNLLKQLRQMGINLPIAHAFMDNPNLLCELGIEKTKGMLHLSTALAAGNPYFKNSSIEKFYRTWNGLWRNKWKTPPYSSRTFEHGVGSLSLYVGSTYWLMSVVERVKTLDPEKIISLWEGDTYVYHNGKMVTMRACDHKTIQGAAVVEYVPPDQQRQSFNIPPYYWMKDASYIGPIYVIPAEIFVPHMDPGLERCRRK
ncbi:MAG: ABC transporter substrate-binding protein [Syntrophales bacterium]|nr:ABC transporter substrate-binding protein [Syntrophales bacterium]